MNELARFPVSSRLRKPRPAAARRPRKPKAHYYAFLSYSHKDEELADWLHQELEDFHVPAALAGKITDNGVVPKRLKPIFRDERELAAADDLGAEIRSALAVSQYLIVLCSPAAATSHWTNAEIEAFKKSRPDGCVLAVIAEGEPFASEIKGREDEECFPPALREKYDRRGRPTGKKAEPLAADLRGGPDERRMGFLKLVAGMLGVGLDDLVQRETTRRQRRMAWITSASLLGMLIAIGLAVFALQARDAARDQRREAEGLVAFMLGDLKDKLEPIGRLDALDGVGSRVLAYYKNQDASELSDSGLMQRSRALSLSAQIAFQRGNISGAVPLYEQAAQGTAEAIRRNPDDPQRLYEHAQIIFWQGELARLQSDMPKAARAYREYKRLADRMAALEPDNLKWRTEVAYANENLGIANYYQRRFPAAAKQFEVSLTTLRGLLQIEPANREFQREAGNVMAWLADARFALGDSDSAIRLRLEQIAFLERTAAKDRDVSLIQQLVPARRALAKIMASQGKMAEAIDHLRVAVQESERLVGIEPQNASWLGFAAQAQLQLAEALVRANRSGDAGAPTASGCASADKILKLEPGKSWLALRTRCLTLSTELALATGKSAEAMELATRTLAAARAESSGDSVRDRYSVAAAMRLLGDVRNATGDRRGAQGAWRSALAHLPSHVSELPPEREERDRILARMQT
jgi:tetratricopeptide (TPR) repeat protein